MRRPTDLPGERELLEELASFDEFDAWMPGGADHDAGNVPSGTELVLQAKRFSSGKRGTVMSSPLSVSIPMTRHDGELIIESLYKLLHPHAGGSIIQMMWLELDEAVDRIQKRVAKGKDPLKADVGEARGLATAIAILTNPYAYDVDAVREEAMQRWDARNPD
jgi:hypothetical protein